MRRENPRAVTMILTLATVAAMTCGASAAIVEHTFSGEVTNLGDFLPPVWLDVAIGSPITASYVFDTETPDFDPTPTFGRYFALAGSITIGDETHYADTVEIRVLNDFVPGLDQYFVSFDLASFGWGAGLLLTGFDTLDPEMGDQPVLDFDIPQWGDGVGHFEVGAGIAGQLTAFSSRPVPAPAAWMVIVGLALGRRRRC